jgi:hypothetical protein
MRQPDKLSEEEQQLLAVLVQEPSVASAYRLGQRFSAWFVTRSLKRLMDGLPTATPAGCEI